MCVCLFRVCCSFVVVFLWLKVCLLFVRVWVVPCSLLFLSFVVSCLLGVAVRFPRVVLVVSYFPTLQSGAVRI